MSRIGKKPIPVPKGVSFAVDGNTVTVKGPKGTVTNHLPGGVALAQQDGHIVVTREDESKRAIHGLGALWSTTRCMASPPVGARIWRSLASATAPS